MADSLKLRYEVTKSDAAKLLLFGYYSRPGWRWVRIVAGPVMIALGIFMITLAGRFNTIYGGAVIGYGAYYALRPFLMMIGRLSRMGDSSSTLEILPGEGLRFSDSSSSSRVDTEKVRGVRLSDSYLTIELRMRKRLYYHVPRACVKEGDIEAFARALDGEISA
jgi:hypothetical protein